MLSNHFIGINDLKPADGRDSKSCFIKECHSTLSRTQSQYRGKHLPYCKIHGIRLHYDSGTFVYCDQNGESKNDARLRNFLFHKEFVRDYVLDNKTKAETHRLGYENSEDALSWNVFVPLMDVGKLSDAVRWLSGKDITGTPELYLWGMKIAWNGNDKACEYPPLLNARKKFENDIRRFPTEPDIMLIIPGKLVMCIEAKFTSGNPVTEEGIHSKPGEKPKNPEGLIGRYMGRWKAASRYLDLEFISKVEKPHSQIFRNIIFAAWMAEKTGADWHVVNLVSDTQWQLGKSRKQKTHGYDFNDPTNAVRSYLHDDFKDNFTFRTWEELYRDLVEGDHRLGELRDYFQQKTACLERAFNLPQR